MNAVISKPRPSTPVTAAAPIENEAPAVTIADIRRWISEADQMLENVYDAAELGEPLDVLLDHLNHSLLCTPVAIITRDDLTQADAKRAYTALFPVLACAHAATKLAEGTMLQHALEGAFELLDAAQSALDSVNDAVRALPEGGPAHDFERGRDLAIRFINEGSTLLDQRDCYRKHREPGAAQKDFASAYLMEAVEEREMLGGFAAVLSQVIGSGETFDGEYFTKLTLADTQPGWPGEDNTQPSNTNEAPVAAVPARSHRVRVEDEPIESYVAICQALTVLNAAALDAGSDLLWGLHSLLEKSVERVEAAATALNAGNYDPMLHENASNEMAGFLGVLGVADASDPNELLGAVQTLVIVAKNQIDNEIGHEARNESR